ncbi:MAG TPA: TetR/AcrR family transcriptional regulator [Acidimicrobiales bacterium]
MTDTARSRLRHRAAGSARAGILTTNAIAPPPDLAEGRLLGPRHLELLDGLEDIVFSEGFSELTVGGLAERLQCSRRTLYEIAESKEQIVLVVVDRYLHRLGRRSHDQAALGVTAFERIHGYVTQGLIEVQEAKLRFAEDAARSPAVHALLDWHFRYAVGEVAAMLSQGMADGEFADINAVLAAELLNAGLARLQDPQVLHAAGVSLSEALEQCLTLFVDGLRPQR